MTASERETLKHIKVPLHIGEEKKKNLTNEWLSRGADQFEDAQGSDGQHL